MEVETACELLVYVLTAPIFRKVTKSTYSPHRVCPSVHLSAGVKIGYH